MPEIQQKFSISAFFKVSVKSRSVPPYDNIITISEADYGLPNKEYYNLPPDNKVIAAYRSLLRDIALELSKFSFNFILYHYYALIILFLLNRYNLR